MPPKPDYENLRSEAEFHWRASGTYLSLLALTGIPIREFNLDPSAGIELYRKGRPLHREVLGEDVSLPGIATPPVSYGHVNGLGARLFFPEGGEVGIDHPYASLDEGITRLREPVDFATAGMAPFFLDYRDKLQAAFPGEKVGFGYGKEGPLTTAYELRGDGFFYDMMDDTAKTAEFLRLLTDSIIDFHGFVCSLSGTAPVNPSGGGLADDIASNVPPHLFPELVLPFWDQYFRGLTTGPRTAHVEDLRPDQLPFLEEAGLSGYDPSISHKLNPKIISERCRVPFNWRLGAFHYRPLDCEGVRDFVFQATADGASQVTTTVEATMCTEETMPKVHAFIAAGKEVEAMLARGATREDVGRCVSAAGRQRFWDRWPE